MIYLKNQRQIALSVPRFLLAALSLLLFSCVAIPTSDHSNLIVQISAPLEPSDVVRAEEIIDNFAHQHGYVARTGVDSEGQAGDALVKGFGYSGAIYMLRAYELKRTSSGGYDQSLPCEIDLLKGAKGELFFGLHDAKNPAVLSLISSIEMEYGKARTRVANPHTIDWLLIGD